MSNIKNQIWSYRWENPQKQRYYRAIISKDMFNMWMVTKVWGGLGKASGRIMHIACESLEEANCKIKSIDRIRLRRGYKLV